MGSNCPVTKQETIPGGGFTVARKIFSSDIWLKPPIYLKVWLWILGRASYADHEKAGQKFKRGEFVTTYDEIIKAGAYYHNRKHIVPTLKQIRIMLSWFQSQGMIMVEPIRASEIDQAQTQTGSGIQSEPPANPHQAERPTRADPRARTRAYIGIRIIVVNYGTYQSLASYKGRDKGRPSVQQGHNNKKEEKGLKEKEPLSFFSLSSLRERYPDQNLIEKVFDAIRSTRKSNRVAKSVLIAFLQKCERYPVQQVEAGFRSYLEKDYADQGKKEEYLLGIIRGTKIRKQRQESTGSALLDAYYAGKH